MSPRARNALAIGAADVLMLVATLWLASAVGGWGDVLGRLPVVLFVLVGVFLSVRRSDNAVGWVLLVTGSVWLLADLLQHGAVYLDATGTGPRALTLGLLWIASWQWVPGLLLVPTLGFLLFPDGRAPSRRWRWVGYASALGMVALSSTYWIGSWQTDEFDYPAHLENPLFVPALEPLRGALFAVGTILALVAVLGALAALVVRYRRADVDTRRQMKWVVLGAAMCVVLYGTGNWTTQMPLVTWELLTGVVFAVMPVSVGLAVLRYRLYDIDRIVSRTISYSLLTLALAGGYAGLVVVLQTLLRPLTGSSDVVVAASTLAVAALFGPMRRRLQSAVDRRFDRARYDAARTIEGFGHRLRDQLELDALEGEVVAVVARTVGPRHASLWLPLPTVPGER